MKAPMEWSTARALADQVLLIPHLRARAAQTMTAGDPLTEAYLAHGVAMDLWKGRAADKPIGDILRGLRVCTGGPPCVRVVPLRIKPAPLGGDRRVELVGRAAAALATDERRVTFFS